MFILKTALVFASALSLASWSAAAAPKKPVPPSLKKPAPAAAEKPTPRPAPPSPSAPAAAERKGVTAVLPDNAVLDRTSTDSPRRATFSAYEREYRQRTWDMHEGEAIAVGGAEYRIRGIFASRIELESGGSEYLIYRRMPAAEMIPGDGGTKALLANRHSSSLLVVVSAKDPSRGSLFRGLGYEGQVTIAGSNSGKGDAEPAAK